MNKNIEAKLLAWALDSIPIAFYHKICTRCKIIVDKSRYKIVYFRDGRRRCYYSDKHCSLCNEPIEYYFDVAVTLPRLPKDIQDAITYRSHTDKFRETQKRFND